MYDLPLAAPRVQIGEYLLDIYRRYSEYHAMGFDAMVDRFASDDFYKAHLMAKRYKELNHV